MNPDPILSNPACLRHPFGMRANHSRLRHLMWMAFLIGAAIAVPQSTPTGAVPKLTLCELVAGGPERYSHTLIQLQGDYRFSREAAGLYGSSCEGRLRIDGMQWSSTVDLRWNSRPTRNARERELLDRAVERVRGAKDRKIVVSVTGRLTVLDDTRVYTDGEGKQHRMGFTMGMMPMRLEVEQINWVRVEEDESNPSDMDPLPAPATLSHP